MLAQLGEQKTLDTVDVLHNVTNDLQLDLNATDAQDRRLPLRPYPERRDASQAYQPWTITGLFNEPMDYHRQACEGQFCRHMWACAGGRQSSWFQRWRRDTATGL